MNKSFITNLIAACLVMLGYFLAHPVILSIGLFAFSGALTNWLAIYMLFEKVPGLYGSGVVPARFEEFKSAIKNMMMCQFFTDENIDNFLSGGDGVSTHLQLEPVIEKIDLSPAFDSLIQVIMQSSFGSMLNMFGGTDALIPLKQPFLESMKSSLIQISQQDDFIESLKSEIEQPAVMLDVRSKISSIIDARLNELTPQLVKEIVHEMINQHLGWLVIWGGVFGGIIGAMSTLIA